MCVKTRPSKSVNNVCLRPLFSLHSTSHRLQERVGRVECGPRGGGAWGGRGGGGGDGASDI